MCGIAGICQKPDTQPDEARLRVMLDALRHRGPDGEGVLIRAGVGLAHARLAVIDPATGAQPMMGPRDTALVANGEIYNFIELKESLLRNARFLTRSDSEVISHLYQMFGRDAVSHLRGMYAFALHDPNSGEVLLARDRFGIKPLYYVEGPSGFAFASEIGALLAGGLASRELVTQKLGELLQLNFTTGRQTIFRDVQRVLPGETLIIKNGRIASRTVLRALPQGGPGISHMPDALEDLDQTFVDSVRVHCRSDVPYGLFLSGGIDSRSILAALRRLGARDVQAYTAAFPEEGARDEFPNAALAAQALGARHVRVEVTRGDFLERFPAVVAHMDDPVGDAAILPTFLLAEQAAKDVKVVLSGEGGDELLAGYSRYRRQALPPWLGGRVRRRTGPFSDNDVLAFDHAEWRRGISDAETATTNGLRTRLQVAQAIDFVDFLPHAFLTKLDRPLMANGVEGRTPFLDLPLARSVFTLPDKLKIRGGRGKHLLRTWLARETEFTDCFAKKQGFTPPYLRWLSDAGSSLGPLVAGDAFIREITRPGAVEPLFASSEKSDLEGASRLLFLALWHRIQVRGTPSDGDIEATLRAAA